ncbi:MAG: exodeoxyribonuclease VII small subunit [Bacteroidales bacterium]|nr:exodeoxyribonuclease VII small subunit [Bacteroidales bacterium]
MENLSYLQAQKELEQIVKDIESGNTDIDLLTEKVKRACQLIAYCNNKLKNTDADIKNILDKFSNTDNISFE